MSSDMTNLIRVKSSIFVDRSCTATTANELLFKRQKCESVISCLISIGHDKQLIIYVLSKKEKKIHAPSSNCISVAL